MLAGLGPGPFFRGNSCTANADCNTEAGVTCCGAGEVWGRCCPDGLCIDCTATDSTAFQYCGTYCPDYPKTTPWPPTTTSPATPTPETPTTSSQGTSSSVTTLTTPTTTITPGKESRMD